MVSMTKRTSFDRCRLPTWFGISKISDQCRAEWITSPGVNDNRKIEAATGMLAGGFLTTVWPALISPAQAQQKRPNCVMLMTDDTGWNDFGPYSNGGARP
jgi:hypothetical protein